MKSLFFPDARINIENAVEAFADTEAQRRARVEQKQGMPTDCPSFAEAVHWLFDDSGLGDGAKTCIGYMLYSEQEAQDLENLMEEIDILLKRHGSRLPSAAYIKLQEWPSIVARAKTCLEMLQANDRIISDLPTSE